MAVIKNAFAVTLGLLSLTVLVLLTPTSAFSESSAGPIKLTPVSQLLDMNTPKEPSPAVLHENKTDKKTTEAQENDPATNTPVHALESGKELPPLNPSPSHVKELSKKEPSKTLPSPQEETSKQSSNQTQTPLLQPDNSVNPQVTDIEDSTTELTEKTEQKKNTQKLKAKKPKKIKQAKKQKKTKEKTVYHQLPAIVVFPVLRHGNEKAFGDVAIIFSNEFANKLEKKFPNTRIHNPVYSVEQLRIKGLSRVYNQMIDYYIKAGRPEPKALKFLLDELATDDGQEIDRVVFIEADIDLHHLQRSFRPKDIFKKLYMDALPNEQRYYVNSRVKVYDTSVPHHPLVWSTTWSHPVKTTRLYNVTASVYQDSDSLSAFSYASRIMSRVVLASSPKKTYQKGKTEIKTSVSGSVQGASSSTNTPEENAKSGAGQLSDADRQALQRLLQKQ